MSPARTGAGAGAVVDPLVVSSASPDDTRAVGAALARCLVPGDVVLLAGDLGSGKTTLVQGVARALGVTEVVTSPTFTLVRTYTCRGATVSPRPGAPEASGEVRTLLHVDVYRLDHLAEVADLGIGELVEDGAVSIVEWGDVAAPVFGDDVLWLSIAPGAGYDDRVVTVRVPSSPASRRNALAEALAPWALPGARPAPDVPTEEMRTG